MSDRLPSAIEAGTRIVILAAGASRRLGRAKQLLPFGEHHLLQHAIDTARQVVPQVWLTLGHQAETCWQSLADHHGLTRIDVPDFHAGMSASIRAAARRAQNDPTVEHLLILLVDQHRVDAPWLRALLTLAQQFPGQAVASVYQDIRGAPAVFPRVHFVALAALDGDTGARALLRGDAGVIEYRSASMPGDVDEPGDLASGVN